MGLAATKIGLLKTPVAATLHNGWQTKGKGSSDGQATEKTDQEVFRSRSLDLFSSGWHQLNKEPKKLSEWEKLELTLKDQTWWKADDATKDHSKDGGNETKKKEVKDMPLPPQLRTFGFRLSSIKPAAQVQQFKQAFIFYPGGQHSDRGSAIIQVDVPLNAFPLSSVDSMKPLERGHNIKQWIPRAWVELPEQFQSGYYSNTLKALTWKSDATTLFDTDVIGLNRLCKDQVRFCEGRTQKVTTDGAIAWDTAQDAIAYGRSLRERNTRWR